MNTRSALKTLAKKGKNLQKNISFQARLALQKKRKAKKDELQGFYLTKVEILHELLDELHEDDNAGALVHLRKILEECMETQRVCRNPFLKVCYRLKIRVIRDTMALARQYV